MKAHTFDENDKTPEAHYIETLVDAYQPHEGWSSRYPYPMEFNDKGFRVIMDGRFLLKDYCLDYADEIINYKGRGGYYQYMDRERIAAELYAHAMAHFLIQSIYDTEIGKKYHKELEGFYKSSDPIDVNYDESTARIILIYSVWSFFDS
jgi:hypothetical protein